MIQKAQEKESCLAYCSMMELKMAYDWVAQKLTASQKDDSTEK